MGVHSGVTDKQAKYSALIAAGEVDKEVDAVVKAGYKYETRYQTLNKLKQSNRVNEYIQKLTEKPELIENAKEGKAEAEESYTPAEEVATREAREKFWTDMMMNPKNSGPVRLEASKLLGKAQGDFKDKKEENKEKSPVLVVPASSPREWEQYWEKKYPDREKHDKDSNNNQEVNDD